LQSLGFIVHVKDQESVTESTGKPCASAPSLPLAA
jgi:hypothetical protein